VKLHASLFVAVMKLSQALAQNAAEVWEMMQSADTHVYFAGVNDMQARVEKALADIAGSPSAWELVKEDMQASGRSHEVLY